MSLSFQQNWFHLIRSSVAQDIAVLVLAENVFLSAFTGSTASQGGSTASAFPSPVVPDMVPGHYRRRPCHLVVTRFFVPFLLSVVPVGLDRYYRPCGILLKRHISSLARPFVRLIFCPGGTTAKPTGSTGGAGKASNDWIRGGLQIGGLLPPLFLTLPTLSPPLLLLKSLPFLLIPPMILAYS